MATGASNGVDGRSAGPAVTQRQVREATGGVHFTQEAGTDLTRLDGVGGGGSTWISLP